MSHKHTFYYKVASNDDLWLTLYLLIHPFAYDLPVSGHILQERMAQFLVGDFGRSLPHFVKLRLLGLWEFA